MTDSMPIEGESFKRMGEIPLFQKST